jgi:hypothetical protein
VRQIRVVHGRAEWRMKYMHDRVGADKMVS